jgi:hypothetical protein
MFTGTLGAKPLPETSNLVVGGPPETERVIVGWPKQELISNSILTADKKIPRPPENRFPSLHTHTTSNEYGLRLGITRRASAGGEAAYVETARIVLRLGGGVNCFNDEQASTGSGCYTAVDLMPRWAGGPLKRSLGGK